MSKRRILSLWFPRLGAERWLRAEPHLAGQPFATVASDGNAQTLAALSVEATAAGLSRGQSLRDAHALCATLLTRPAMAHREQGFLDALHRWAGKFSPWVAAEPPDALVIDLTGCAHLFGGEQKLCDQVARDCADLGLTVRLGLADTLGAAWALARFAEGGRSVARSGDAIDQEAPATRARAGKRRAISDVPAGGPVATRIAAPGAAWGALSALPISALRLPPQTVEQLTRLGLRQVGDILGQPRAGLARRFGRGLVERLDQAMGSAPEPVSPKAAPERFAVRMSFPDPIGLEDDVAEAFARMTERLCARLKNAGRGVRTLRMEIHRCDHEMIWQTVTAARAADQAHRLVPLMKLKIPGMDAGPGIDMLRLEALVTEPLHARITAGHAEAAALGARRRDRGAALEDLIGRLGARLGMEAVTRRHPADSHIPEKGSKVVPAAWTDPSRDWQPPPRPRPLMLWHPEPVHAPDTPRLPGRFRWRGRDWQATGHSGPERIAPEWWFDDPAWRSGHRDYWQVETDRGDRLWLFYAHGGTLSSGWFCHGGFA